MSKKTLLRDDQGRKSVATPSKTAMTPADEKRFVELLEGMTWIDILQRKNGLILINHGDLFFSSLLAELKKGPCVGKSVEAFLELRERVEGVAEGSLSDFSCASETLNEILIALLRKAVVNEKFVQTFERQIFGFA